MDKQKLIKFGSLIGLTAAIGYRVYSAVKNTKQEQEVIDITPEESQNKDSLK